QLNEVARFGTWSPQRLHALNPIPAAASLIAGAVLVPVAVWTLRSVHLAIRVLWLAHRSCRHLDNPGGSPVVVVDSNEVDAFTLPGLSARIVVTTGILAALDAGGRRVVLAHEQSHRAFAVERTGETLFEHATQPTAATWHVAPAPNANPGWPRARVGVPGRCIATDATIFECSS